jgi:hypothetical protein
MRQLLLRPTSSGVVRFHAWFATCSPIYASLVIVAAVLLVAAALYPVAAGIDALLGRWIHLPAFEFRRWPFVIIAVVISPLVETIVFQYAVFRIAYLSDRFRQKGRLIIAFSALLFGIQHFYSAGYMIMTTGAGAVFSTGFLFAGTFNRGFWTVTAAHAVVNGVALAIKWIQ